MTGRQLFSFVSKAVKGDFMHEKDREESVQFLSTVHVCNVGVDQVVVGEEVVEEADSGVGLGFNLPGSVNRGETGVPCTQFINLDLHLVVSGGVDSEACGSDEEIAPNPLCSIHPGIEWNNTSFDWVLRKVEEIKDCTGISCGGFEQQFQALLIAIEAGQPSLAKSVAKKERKLKKSWYSIIARGGSAFRAKGKRVANCFP